MGLNEYYLKIEDAENEWYWNNEDGGRLLLQNVEDYNGEVNKRKLLLQSEPECFLCNGMASERSFMLLRSFSGLYSLHEVTIQV